MKRSLLLRTLLLIYIAALLLNGCASLEQIEKNNQEVQQAYNAPENLGANTQRTGLLLVDAVTKKALNTMPLEGVVIVNIKEPGMEIVFGTFNTGGFLSGRSGVVVIPNIQPGTYKIVKIKTSNANYWEVLNMPVTKEYEIGIKSGDPVYFGQIEVKHPIGTTDRIIKIKHEISREIESWKLVVDNYKDSPWVDIINAHIKEFE